MKKFSAAVFLWACLLCLTACSPNPGDIPALRQLALETPAGVNRALEGTTREALVRAWGEPDGMLSGLYGDVWRFGEDGRLIVYYDAESRFQEAKLRIE